MIDTNVFHEDFGNGIIVAVYKTNKDFNPTTEDIYVVQFNEGPKVGLHRNAFNVVFKKKKVRK